MKTSCECRTGVPGPHRRGACAPIVDDRGAWPHGIVLFVGDRELAIPCSSLDDKHCTLNFLSASQAPIAQAIESWGPKADGSELQRMLGFSEELGALPAGAEGPSLAMGLDDSIVIAFETGIARMSERGAAAESASLLAIPIIAEGKVSEVVALTF